MLDEYQRIMSDEMKKMLVDDDMVFGWIYAEISEVKTMEFDGSE